MCPYLFNTYANRENVFSLFRFWRQNGFLKNIPSSSSLCLTSLFHHSVALSRLFSSCLVTDHLCHGAIQSLWWPLGVNKSKWQNGNGDRHDFFLNWGTIHKSRLMYHRLTVWILRHGILWIRKCVWWSLVAVSLTHKRTQCLQSASVKVEQSACLMQLRTQLSSVVWQEEPKREAPRVLMKTRLGSHMVAEKQTWSRLEAKQAERGLPASFQLFLKDSSCYSPGASPVWIYWAQKETAALVFAKPNHY